MYTRYEDVYTRYKAVYTRYEDVYTRYKAVYTRYEDGLYPLKYHLLHHYINFPMLQSCDSPSPLPTVPHEAIAPETPGSVYQLAPIAPETMVCEKYINTELRTLRKLRKQRV